MAPSPDPEPSHGALSGMPVRRRPGRRTLVLITAPIIVLVVMSNIGDALAPSLVDTHPLTLIALNARNRNLVLVTNQLDAFSYYAVGTVRLLVSDPLFFLLGYWYGEAAVTWMEKRTRTAGTMLRQAERWFGKAVYPLIFVAPNNVICLFAGAAGLSVAGFFAVNVAGTITRLYLIRVLGETFQAPIDDVLGLIADYRIPLLAVSIGFVVLMSVLELRRGDSEIEGLAHIDEELADAERELVEQEGEASERQVYDDGDRRPDG